MKNRFINLALMSLVAISVTACPSPNNSNTSTPGSSASPGTGSGVVSGDAFATKANFLAFAECLKGKFPEVVGPIQGYINQANALSDSEWAAVSANFRAIAGPYLNRGCN